MRISTFILLIILTSITCFGQDIKLFIYDSETNRPIEYANIQIVNTRLGTVSNSEGYFEVEKLKSSQKEFKVSSMGYKTVLLSTEDARQIDTVLLSPKTFELSEFKLYPDGLSAIEIVRRGMGSFKDRCYHKPYQMKMFYRHYCKERDVYGRLIEAAITVSDNKGHKKRFQRPSEKIGVSIDEIRRSHDYTKNFDVHEPISIFGTLQYDLSSYNSILHYYPEDFNFQLIDTTFYDNSLVWVISYEYDEIQPQRSEGDTTRMKCEGKLFINASNFAILEISESQKSEESKTYEFHCYELKWRIKYQLVDDKYFISYISETGYNLDEAMATDFSIVTSKDHRFKVEMMTSEVILFDFEKIHTKEPNHNELSKMNYHPEFWKNYLVLEDSPLDKQILYDLEQRRNLESQFMDKH